MDLRNNKLNESHEETLVAGLATFGLLMIAFVLISFSAWISATGVCGLAVLFFSWGYGSGWTLEPPPSFEGMWFEYGMSTSIVIGVIFAVLFVAIVASVVQDFKSEEVAEKLK